MEITGVKIIAGNLFFLVQGEWLHEDLVTSPEAQDAVLVFFKTFSKTIKLADRLYFFL